MNQESTLVFNTPWLAAPSQLHMEERGCLLKLISCLDYSLALYIVHVDCTGTSLPWLHFFEALLCILGLNQAENGVIGIDGFLYTFTGAFGVGLLC